MKQIIILPLAVAGNRRGRDIIPHLNVSIDIRHPHPALPQGIDRCEAFPLLSLIPVVLGQRRLGHKNSKDSLVGGAAGELDGGQGGGKGGGAVLLAPDLGLACHRDDHPRLDVLWEVLR